MTPAQPVGNLPYCIRGYLNLYAEAVRKPTRKDYGWQHNWNGTTGVILFLHFLSNTDATLQSILAPLLQRLRDIPDDVDPSFDDLQPLWKPYQAELHALAPSADSLRSIIEPKLSFFQGKLNELNQDRRSDQLARYSSCLNDPAMNGPFGPVIAGGHADLEAYRLNAAYPNAFPADPTDRTYHYNVNDPASFLLAPGRCF